MNAKGRTVRLQDVRSVPDMAITPEDVYSPPNGQPAPELFTIVPFAQFVETQDDIVEPLVGAPDDALLPAEGLLLLYGDGGAGKTTLSIDAACHLAAGDPWLGIDVPRPLRILLIENEGPRGPFRQRLANKLASWQGNPFSDNIMVLEEPWSRFTLTEPDYRASLAMYLEQLEVDLLIVGPLASLGARGTGTPDDINEFDRHVKDLKNRTQQPFAIWIVHHENKAGDVSGAWERYPDSLVHVTAQGNGRTHIHWRKVRWSSSLHGTNTSLLWADGGGFAIEAERPYDLEAELLEAFTITDKWRTAKEAAKLINRNVDNVKETLSSMVEKGELIYLKGPQGRSSKAQCWKLSTDSNALSQSESVSQPEGGERATDSLTHGISESVSESVVPSPEGSDSTDLGKSVPTKHIDVHDPSVQALLDDNDGIPF
jgi:hypothetical protein